MIKTLSNAYAPSAKEEEVRKIIINDLSDFYKDISVDNLGNLIIHKPGKTKTIAITAPMDEVSFVITHEKNDNFVVATSVCPVKSKTLQNNIVVDENDFKYIINDIPNISSNTEKIRNVEFKKINNCKVNSLNNAFISNSLIYNKNFIETDDLYIGKALERSVLCSILCDIARSVSNSLYEYYFIFSAQNYCDKKGALTATYNLEINELYNLCAVDTDEEKISIGKGPVLVLRDKMLISDKKMAEKFEKNDKQYLISSNFVCEGGYYQRQQSTQKIISVGIPIDFLGCFNEAVSKKDIKSLKTIILEKVLP